MKFRTLTARYLQLVLAGAAVFFCALTIVACGGAASTTSSNVPSLILSLVDSSGNAATSMVVGNSYTLIATTSQTGGAAANVVVTFSAGSNATLSPTAGTALTNSAGVATMVIVPSTAGASSASASASVPKITTTSATSTTAAVSTTTYVTVTGTTNYGVTSTSSSSTTPSLTLSLVDSGGNVVNSMTLGTNYRLTATATDTTGLASNAIVTFSPSGGASTIPSAGTALTNGSGVAQIVVVPGTAGAWTASASFTATTGAITKSINFSIATTPTTTLGTLTPASTSLTSGGTTTLTINTLVNQALTSGVSVLFSTTCGQITTTNPATSNSSGVATATYSSTTAGGSLCSGAVTVQATAGGSTAYATITVASPVITLTSFTASPSSISSGANSALSLTVKSNGVTPTSSVSVSLSATCGQVSPSVATTNGSGVISATYSSVKSDGTLCSGSDTVAATATGATASTSITVAAPTTGSISFVSASPAQIFLSNSGAAATTTLSFKSLLSTGAVAPSTSVQFTLTGNPGGVTFGTSGNTAAYTVTSDSSGVATVLVYAGNVPGAVTITAVWTINSAVTTTSNGLTVASGPPQEKTITLTASKTNMDAWQYDGDTTTITARVADQNGNPVPDGTVINFVSSGGQINRSCSTSTANSGGLNASGFSQCQVTLMGQNPRPTNGRVAVLAYLEGVKNYTDVNGDGAYTAGTDTLIDLGDAYRDDNENGVYDAGEFVITKGGSTTCTGAGGLSSTGYGGGQPARVNTCTGALAGVVRRQIPIFFSSNIALDPQAVANAGVTFIKTGTTSFTGTAAKTLTFYVKGSGPSGSLLPLPSGTTVNATSQTAGCTASNLFPTTVSNAIYTGTSAAEDINLYYSFQVTLTGTPATSTAAAITCAGASLQVSYTTTVSGVSGVLYYTVP